MIFKIIFTWWNKQTLGTYLKTLFFGIYVGKDEFGNRYYKSKKNERWVIYSSEIEATKITSEWYLWMHHTTNILPNEKDKKPVNVLQLNECSGGITYFSFPLLQLQLIRLRHGNFLAIN